MKSRAIKKSKKTIAEESKALMHMQDAVKLYYENRFFSAKTLAGKAAETLTKITQMKAYQNRIISSMGLRMNFDKKLVATKKRSVTKEISDLKIDMMAAAQSIWLTMVLYHQINDRYPTGKYFERFRKDRNIGAWQSLHYLTRKDLKQIN